MSLGGGSSSSSTTTIQQTTDPEAANRMAGVAERSQSLAEQEWSLYQNTFLPYDTALVDANMQNVQPTADLTNATLKAQMELLPQQTKATKQFLKQALEGVDADQRAGQAATDVELAYKGLPKSMSRQAAGMGISPNSGAFQSQLTGLGLSKARDKAYAETSARRQAEGENFSRLSAAQGLNWQGTNANQGGYSLTNPADRAVSLYQQTIAANAAGMSPLTKSSGRSSGFNASVGI